MIHEPSLILKNVTKTFHLNQRAADTLKGKIFNSFMRSEKKILKAVDNVSLEIAKGETLGIIGRNGSGKSTLIKIMSGSFVPDKGGVVIRNGSYMLLNLGIGLSHELTARENIYVVGSTLGLRLRKVEEIFDQIIDFAELKGFVDTKIKYFSTGMIQRLSFSIAVNARADIMFLDEVFAVGDEVFRSKATKVLEKNWLEGRTVVIVSHSMSHIQKYCQRVLYLKKGKMVYLGDPQTAIKLYHEDNVSDEITAES